MASFPGGQTLRILGLLAAVTAPALGFGDEELGAIVGHHPDLSRYGEPGGLWMGRDFEFSIDGAGSITATEHMVARIVDPKWGTEHFSPYRFHYWAEQQAVRVARARIWKGRNEFVELPREFVKYEPSPLAQGASAYEVMRMLRIDFPELVEGDVVEILIERSHRLLPGEFNIRWFTRLYGDNIPTIEERVSITAPSALGPFIEQIGTPIRGYRKRRGGFVERFWTTGHLQAFSAELEQSFFSRRSVETAVPDSSSQIVFATSTWHYLSRYFGRHWERYVNDVSMEMRQKISDITQTTQGTARARTIERWIQNDIETLPITHRHQGLRPQPPSLVFAGASASTVDKTLLLVAALRLAGLNGSPVLIRTREEAWLPEMGCPDQLDRFLVRVRLSEDDFLWLDPVDSGSSIPETVGWIIAMSELETDAGMIDVPAR